MPEIHINEVLLTDDYTVEFDISCSRHLRKFLTDTNLYARYPTDISEVPESILVVPLLSNLCPVAWITGADIYVDELDSAFYQSLPMIKDAFTRLYPDAPFDQDSSVRCKSHVDNRQNPHDGQEEQIGMLFTGGVDSTATFLRHRKKDPVLISVLDSHIDQGQWEHTATMINSLTKETGADHYVIDSNMQDILHGQALTLYYGHLLNRGWFTAAQFGIGYTGLTAPLTYLNHIDRVYQGSGYTTNQQYPMAAQPPLVNNLSWAGTSAEIDAIDQTRQDKIEIIANYVKNHDTALEIHSCDNAETTANCSICEKCLRTITGLVVAGVNPDQYGFNVDEMTFDRIRTELESDALDPAAVSTRFWIDIQDRTPDSVNLPFTGVNEFLDWFGDANLLNSRDLEFPDVTLDRKRWLCLQLPYPIDVLAMQTYGRLKNTLR